MSRNDSGMNSNAIVQQFKATVESDVELYAMVRHTDTLGEVTFVRQHVTLGMLEQALKTFGYTIAPVASTPPQSTPMPISKIHWTNWRADQEGYHAKYEGYSLDIWESEDEWRWEVKDVIGTTLTGDPTVTYQRALSDANKALIERLSAPDWLDASDIVDDEEDRKTTVE